MEPLRELDGHLLPSLPTPGIVQPPPPAHGVVSGSWVPVVMDKYKSVFIKSLPFPGRADTAHDGAWGAWRERGLKILQARIQNVGELDATYVLKPLGYRLHYSPCLVVPRTEGGNILQYVLSQPDLTIDDKLALLLGAARCVAYLHNQEPPVVHGGIHPTQFLIGNQRRPVLFDFGIVSTISFLDPPPCQATIRPSNPIGGYYAPELMEQRTAAPATDVYAFAGVMLSVMTGIHPHQDYPVSEVAWFAGKPSPSAHSALHEKHPLWSLMNQMWEREILARPDINKVVSFLEGLVITNRPQVLPGPVLTQDLQEVGPEDKSLPISEIHPRIQTLVDEVRKEGRLRELEPKLIQSSQASATNTLPDAQAELRSLRTPLLQRPSQSSAPPMGYLQPSHPSTALPYGVGTPTGSSTASLSYGAAPPASSSPPPGPNSSYLLSGRPSIPAWQLAAAAGTATRSTSSPFVPTVVSNTTTATTNTTSTDIRSSTLEGPGVFVQSSDAAGAL